MKTVVISNGKSCLNYEAGLIIDGYDIVVRINNFQTKGFEKCVGSKTDLIITNGNPDIKYKDENRGIPVIITQNIKWNLRDYCRENNLDNISCINILFDSWTYANQFGVSMPSTGLHSILFLITMYKKVWCYGFDSFATPHHYFDEKHISNPDHTNNEKFILEDLIQKGKLIRLESEL